jgi:phosphomevalonate kinase
MIATAPGKLIVTGEYAVLDGAPAIVIAVDRRAIARRNATPRGSSPFLLAVADEIAARRGAADPAATAALEVSVDSTAFYDRMTKLGLGSSAAVTVAATALALGTADRHEVLEVALAAHARAQGPLGARGSGADIAASVHGGTIVFSLPGGAGPCHVERRRWPASVAIFPFFTGAPADTAQLVGRVQAARDAHRTAVDAALTAVAVAIFWCRPSQRRARAIQGSG